MCNESKMLTHLFIFRFLLESYEYDSVLVRLINDHPKQKKKNCTIDLLNPVCIYG